MPKQPKYQRRVKQSGNSHNPMNILFKLLNKAVISSVETLKQEFLPKIVYNEKKTKINFETFVDTQKSN